MKYRLRYLISAALLLGTLSLSPAIALAHDGESNSGSTSSGSNETENETETEFEHRIDTLKTKFKVRLEVSEKLHLKGKCKAAQAVVGKHQGKFGTSITVRTQAYTELQKNLDKLVEKLKTKGVDTATLESQITELKSKIDTYKTDLDAYKQTLADLKKVDCASDQDAFMAALDAARAARDKLISDVVGIKTYLKGTIKPTLVNIRKSLESSSDDSSESSNDSDNSTNTSGSN